MTARLRAGDREHVVNIDPSGEMRVDDRPSRVRIESARDGLVTLLENGRRVRAYAVADGETVWVSVQGRTWRLDRIGDALSAATTAGSQARHAPARRTVKKRRRGHQEHGLSSPMPATVIKVLVSPGDTVTKGDVVLVLEAMKMELPIRAPADGRVVSVSCSAGELVQPGVPLVEIE